MLGLWQNKIFICSDISIILIIVICSLLLKNNYLCQLISVVVAVGIAVYISLAVSHSYCEVASVGSDANMGYHFIFGLIAEGCFVNCWNND